MSLHDSLATLLPASVAQPSWAVCDSTRGQRSRISRGTIAGGCPRATAWPLASTGSRGYNYAEVTAGGVALDEIDPSTMASRIRPGLFLVGEILDVDGRIGGFNFQWAWSSARVAAAAVAMRADATDAL